MVFCGGDVYFYQYSDKNIRTGSYVCLTQNIGFGLKSGKKWEVVGVSKVAYQTGRAGKNTGCIEYNMLDAESWIFALKQ